MEMSTPTQTELRLASPAASPDTRASVARAIQAARDLVKLDRPRGLIAFNELFRAGLPPQSLLAGEYSGELVALDFTPVLTPLFGALASTYMPWLGKEFISARAGGENVMAQNSLPLARVLWPLYRGYAPGRTGTYHAFRFRTSRGPGLLDPDRTVLKLDYDLPENPRLTVRRVLDELVELADGLYLGKAHLHWLGGGWQTVAFFTLSTREVTGAAAPSNPLLAFDPVRVARFETENWVAYYQKRWLKLMGASVGMVREAFQLSLPQALYAAYLVARAEIAAAPFPDNDIPKAEAYMRRFYAFIQNIHHAEYDVAQVARLEVNWWVVHRQLFAREENQGLVDALTELYATLFRLPPERVHDAAFHRAQAMVYSDRWVKEGCIDGSPLIAQEEAELYRSYAVLKQAVTGRTPEVNS